jgi:hypothetical protein
MRRGDDPDAGGLRETEARSSDLAVEGGGSFGVGLRPGEGPVALGFGASLEAGRRDSTLALPLSSGDASVAGTLVDDRTTDLLLLLQDGEWRERTLDLEITAGIAVEKEPVDLDLDLRVHRGWVSMEGEASAEAPQGAAWLRGFRPGSPGLALPSEWLFGGTADVEAAVRGPLSLRARVDGGVGPLRPSVLSSSRGGTDADGSWSEEESLSDPEGTVWQLGGLLAFQLEWERLAVRVGVEVLGEGEHLRLERVIETVVGDGAAAETTVLGRGEEADERLLVVSTPIAAEVQVHPRWTLRVGGRWRQVHATESFVARPEGASLPAEEALTVVDRPEVELAFGLSWAPISRFSLDLMASGVAIGEERLSLSLGALMVSAVFHDEAPGPSGPATEGGGGG